MSLMNIRGGYDNVYIDRRCFIRNFVSTRADSIHLLRQKQFHGMIHLTLGASG